VKKARDFSDLLRDGDLQVSVATRDGSRRTVAISVLEQAGAVPHIDDSPRSLVIEAGTPGDEVALNPQPLPPKWLDRLAGARGDDRAIIVVGGRPGDEVALNPQPLPPRWRQQVADVVQALEAQGQGGVGFRLRNRDEGEAFAVGGGGIVRMIPRGPGAVLIRQGGGLLGGAGGRGGLLGRPRGREVVRGGVDVPAAQAQVPDVISQAANAVVATVDGFGDLVTTIDPDLVIPDTVNPTGSGSVRGIDFRVRPQG
jgi:hypothetical protein